MNWNNLLNAERLRSSTRNVEFDHRNEFESDFGRVIFSPATRRMHDKTQVFPLTTDDNIHSRLTHSLEVMSIGHSLGLNICDDKDFINSLGVKDRDLIREIPIILKNACLVHDIGNPPFGHFGETVIQTYFAEIFETKDFGLTKVQQEDFTNFDGNAQGFRVLTKLQVLEDLYGLNLTFASLAAYLKYPNTGEINKAFLYKKKRGVFQSEESYLKRIAEGCGLYNGDDIIRHPLSYLMEAADSICYLVVDIEDGFNKGLYDYKFVKSELSRISGLPQRFEVLENTFQTDIARIVNLRIYLIKRLVDLAVKNFKLNIDKISQGLYNQELIHDDVENLADILQEFSTKQIFPKRDVQFLELTGHSVLTGLLNYYLEFTFQKNKAYSKRALGLISQSVKKVSCLEQGVSNFDDLDNYYKLRVIVDFISGMTDQYAVNHFQKLSGQKLADIREKIDNAGPAFHKYLDLLLSQELMEKLSSISSITEVYLFSGIIRNYFLNIYRKRDVDVVLGSEIDIEKEFGKYPILKNSFGGYKILFPSGPLDLWFIKDTWAFKYSQTTLDFDLEKKIPDTTFFNFSSIIYSFNKQKFYYTNHFIKFLRDKKLDYVYKRNPNYALCIINTFYYSEAYDLQISERLAKLILNLYEKGNYDYDAVQIKHFGSLLYTTGNIQSKIRNLKNA